MTLQELKSYAEEMSAKYPQLDDEIRDLYFLAVTEVEDGEPEYHECELAVGSIDELIAELDRI
jgi:hypothetical protein